MKKNVFFFLTLLSLAFMARAYDFSAACSTGQTLYYLISGTTVSVSSPYTYNGSTKPTGRLKIPSSVTYRGTTYSVTSIGYSAFNGCTGLTSVTIPNSVTSIGGNAFYGCSSLTNVDIPNLVTSIGTNAFNGCTGLTTLNFNATNCTTAGSSDYPVFNGCSNLSTVIIGSNVTKIPAYVFSGCSRLTSVSISNSVTSIGQSAFSDCSGLTSITIPSSVTSIGQSAFSGCSGLTSIIVVSGNPKYNSSGCNAIIETATNTLITGCQNTTVPNSVTIIGQYAFSGCSGLTNITIPNSVTSIGQYAFSGCSGLTSVTIPSSVTSIGKSVFSDCSGLTSVTIPNTVTSIGYSAFNGCTGLTSVTIPNSVTSIGGNAFYGCSSLTNVDIPNSVTSIGNYSFYNCAELTSVSIPNSVTNIGKYTFSGCSSLTSVTIPNLVTSIGDHAFTGCRGLTSVTIPNSVTSIGDYVFYGCSGLTCIIIPNSVTSIGDYAFHLCSGLTSVRMFSSIPPRLGTRVFGSTTTGITLEIPCGSLASYQQAWGTSYNYSEEFVDYTLTLESNNNDWGSVSFVKQNGHDIACDGYAIFSANANDGYLFTQWNDGNTSNPRSVLVTEDVTYTAQFLSNSSIYTITVYTNDASMGSVIGGGDYMVGSSATLVAIPQTGCFFQQWSDGNTDNPRTVTVTGNTTYTAQFVSNNSNYTVTVVANDASMGSVLGGGNYMMGSTATLAAIPQTGYFFQQWNDGNTDNPRTVTVTGDATYTAIFAASSYEITVTANDATMGSVMGGGSYTMGSTATLIAIPRARYYFLHWNDGNTDNPRTVTVTGNATYTAQFAANVQTSYTVTATANDATMGSILGCGSYASGATVTLTAVPAPCHHLVAWSNGATTENISFTATENVALTATFARDADQHSYERVTSCLPYTWEVNGKTYNKSGTKTYKGTTAEGCISRDTLELNIIKGYGNTVEVTSCVPYTWAVTGKTYNKSGVKTCKSYTDEGCPIYDTLTLNIIKGYGNTVEVTSCVSYTWDVTGRTYNKSGVKTYKSSQPDADGCYTYDTLRLNIIKGYSHHEYVENCGPYYWDVTGKTYNKSGMKTYKSAPDADGCPTYDTLELVVLNCDKSPDDNSQLSTFNSQLSIYPNPTTGLVHIDVKAGSENNFNSQLSTFNLTVEVLDLVGRRVALFENSTTLDLSNLAKGTYTLRVTMPEGVTVRKVVKK